MTRTWGTWALLLALACVPRVAAAAAQPGPHALLDVPYMAQPPELCGGAAVAMVLRYWGARDVFPQDFAALVREGGILTGALTAAVAGLGWQAHVLPPVAEAAAALQVEVDKGRPIIALVEVSRGAYHYVVVVAVSDDAVVVHDPALAPFRVLRWAEFDVAWAAAGRWMLRVLPQEGFSVGTRPVHPAGTSDAARMHAPALETACQGLVARSVRAALTGDGTGAGQGLAAAIGLCPAEAAPRRELAGLRFTQHRWPEAEVLAREAVGLAPDDIHAWRLLATTQHLMGNAAGALMAWNRADEPRIDAVQVHGAARTRYPVVVRTLGLEPRALLTPAVFGQGLRRLRALPGVSAARLRYEPLAGGRARVDAFIDERPALPRGWVPLGVVVGRTLALREVVVDVPVGLGAGERAQFLWRWAARRPRVALGLSLPAPEGMPGVLTFEGAWERQTYTSPTPSSAWPATEERRRFALQLSDWATHWLRWQVGAGLDGWRIREQDHGDAVFQSREFVTVDGGVDVRLAGDRLAVGAVAGWWAPVVGQRPFEAGTLRVSWRSSVESGRPSWFVTSALAGASGAAPFAVWAGAGTGQGRDGLLRAHPLLRDGVVAGPAFGRVVPRGSLTYTRPVRTGVSVAAFVDVARAWRRLSGPGASPLFIDAGAGIRVQDSSGGAFRVDIARGLRGGGLMMSAGWDEAWPQ